MKLHQIKQTKCVDNNQVELTGCFQASSALDFILQNKPVSQNQSEFKMQSALSFMRILLRIGTFRFVSNDDDVITENTMLQFTAMSTKTTYIYHEIAKNYVDIKTIKDLLKDMESLKKLYELMTSEKGVEIKDFTYNDKVFKNTFVGSQAVDWFVKTFNISRRSALVLGDYLIKMNVIQTPKSNPQFKDGQYYYKVWPIEKIQVVTFITPCYTLEEDFKEDYDKSTRVFAVDPEIIAKREKSEMPLAYKQMIDHLLKDGDKVNGIFREGGSHDRILQLILKYDLGETVNLSDYTMIEIASCLKRYLKTLPEPLIPYDTFDAMIKLIDQKEDEFLAHLTELIVPLSDIKKKMLDSLFNLLCKISLNSDENNMIPKNLAVVMGFNILTPKNNDPVLLRDLTSKIIFVTEKLIELYPKYLK